jgi:hypothetical protein
MKNCMFLLLLAVTAVFLRPPRAQAQTSPCNPSATYCALDNLVLVKTRLVMTTSFITLQCNSSPCQSFLPLFGKYTGVVCPGPIGQTCTFDVQVGALASQSPGDLSDIEVSVVDGVVLTPTVYPLAVDPPSGGTSAPDSISAPFTLHVTNTMDNERHLITLLARLQGVNASNSTHILTLQGARLRVDVFKP